MCYVDASWTFILQDSDTNSLLQNFLVPKATIQSKRLLDILVSNNAAWVSSQYQYPKHVALIWRQITISKQLLIRLSKNHSSLT